MEILTNHNLQPGVYQRSKGLPSFNRQHQNMCVCVFVTSQKLLFWRIYDILYFTAGFRHQMFISLLPNNMILKDTALFRRFTECSLK